MTSPAVVERALERVKAAILAMDLPGVSSGQVEIRKLPWDDRQLFQGITVYLRPENEALGTNLRDDIGYGVAVAMVRTTTKDFFESTFDIATIRQRLRRKFHNKRLDQFESDDCHVIQCKVVGGAVEVPKKFQDGNYDVSQMTIWCWFREYRTDPT